MAEREYFPGAVQHDLRMEAAASSNAADVKAETVASTAVDGLDGKTKDELLVEAEARNVDVKTSATKDEILKALRG